MDVKRISNLRTVTPILLILLLGAILRFTGIDWGTASLVDFQVDGRGVSIQSAGFHPDANSLTVASESLSQSIHPHHTIDGEERLYSVYGPVFMYLFWLVGKPFSWVAGFDLFNLQDFRDSNLTRLAGRGLSAITGTLTILFTYLIGTRCYGRSAGLIAALLLALTPLHIQSSHFCTVDVLVTLWMTVAFLVFLSVADRGKPIDYLISGGWIGVACATKLNAIGLFVPLGFAHLIHISRIGGKSKTASRSLRNTLFDYRLSVALGASLVVFFLLVPSSLLRFGDYFDPENHLTAISGVLVNMGMCLMRGSVHFAGTTPYLYHVTNLFPAGIGIPLEIAVFLGIAWAVYRHQRVDVLLLSFVVFYFLTTGGAQVKYIRYFVLWMPFVAILSARFLVEICGSSRAMIRFFGIIFATVVVLLTSVYAAAFAGIYHQEDPRVRAARWVAGNIPPGAVILLERGHNGMRELLSAKDHDLRSIDIHDLIKISGNTELIRNGYYGSVLYQLYLRDPDYLIISDDRLASGDHLPFATMYYDTLMDGGWGYSVVGQFQIKPEFLGIPFDDSWADVTWRRFDHPRIFVFRNTRISPDFDPNYRANLELKSPEKAHEIFRTAVRKNDILLLHGCLSRDIRTALSPGELAIMSGIINENPEILDRLSEPRFVSQEPDGWGLHLKMRAIN